MSKKSCWCRIVSHHNVTVVMGVALGVPVGSLYAYGWQNICLRHRLSICDVKNTCELDVFVIWGIFYLWFWIHFFKSFLNVETYPLILQCCCFYSQTKCKESLFCDNIPSSFKDGTLIFFQGLSVFKPQNLLWLTFTHYIWIFLSKVIEIKW